MQENRKRIMEYRDVITVPETISYLFHLYETLGYQMSKKIMFAFWYFKEDKSRMIVYWEDGFIYEEVQRNKEEDL